ncbi:MAG TPA: hypothetical protein VN451_05155 [Chitinophagaceae bacterium]|nr:hypothetical protein [Chitinophagaceae bacterium]
MKRVVVIHWKGKSESPFEVFSNLKILCESYPAYNYNTLNNYLSKNKVPYENEKVKIERKMVQTAPLPQPRVVLVGKRVKAGHNEEKQNLDFWLSRPVSERLDAVTMLRSQVLKKNERMKRNYGLKRQMR